MKVRNALFDGIAGILRSSEKAYFLSADLGFMLFEPFLKKYPSRFINVGVAEANMVGLASGLARMGKQPYCYSMIPFITMRCLEQIRVHMSMGKLNIKLIGVGAGYAYGVQGCSHHAVEDIGIMASMPNLSVFSPSDNYELEWILSEFVNHRGPAYLRLGRTQDSARLRGEKLKIGKPALFNSVKSGKERVIIFSTGTSTVLMNETLPELGRLGISSVLYSVHTIKPFNVDLRPYIPDGSFVVTSELNVKNGGLCSILSQRMMEQGIKAKGFKSFNIPDDFLKTAGETDRLEARIGFERRNMVGEIHKLVRG